MSNIATYERMKDSKERWLGDIPSTWNTRLLKYMFSIKKNIAGETGHQVLSVTQKGIVPKNMTERGQFSLDYSKYQLVEAGDFVMNHMDLLTGWVDISKYDGVTSPDYRVFVNNNPDSFDSKYYNYIFQYCYSNRIFYGLGQGVAGYGRWRLPTDMFMNFALPVPPIDQQRRISYFLDKQCAQIDSIIEDTKSSVEEYKKWKASIIFEAVTKGIVPGVEMRDSGLHEFGNVPKTWYITKTLHCLSMPITDGPHTTPEFFDSGVPFVSAEAISCGNGKIAFDHIRGYISEEFYQECCKKYIPQIDDIYMIKSGATTGKVAIVDTDIKFTIWSPIAVFRADKSRILPKFLFYALQSPSYQTQVALGWTYGTQQNIGMRTLETLKLCVPSLEEQKQIVAYLDRLCSEMDALISEKEALVSDLEVYKRSLVFETVTGKRKVV